MRKTKQISALIILFSSFYTYSQDKTFGLKFGYGISNAYAPNGELIFYTDGSAGQGNDSFTYTSAFQIGLSKEFYFRNDQNYLLVNAQYATNGYEDNIYTVDLDYIELDATIINELGRDKKFFLGIGGGISYLLNHSEEIDAKNKLDVRSNAMVGYKLSDNLKIYFQGKAGWIGLSKENKIKSYMLSFNTEFMLF
ncbi:hypothetical protein VOI54_03895 [Tamlana sp. 2201CG12-4]|uniref:hypothetical protein n=1 Tax=Tamlana sp. 2201CG12-4 TaxID=3112582 RepID=UPI002DB82EE1|nr:hypothetical protein [Tamlana sp. 2201CG12-4]MEC3906146.1 hypothetical protein [Tamlana sp. 2201CG12-4]